MKLIVCLDDQNGMSFLGRRQSRDRLLMEDMKRHLDGQHVWIAPKSEVLFQNSGISYKVAEAPLETAGMDEYCFVETQDPAPYAERMESLIIYRWNRHYPSDVVFTMDLSCYCLCTSVDFVGHSHEKITKEEWTR